VACRGCCRGTDTGGVGEGAPRALKCPGGVTLLLLLLLLLVLVLVLFILLALLFIIVLACASGEAWKPAARGRGRASPWCTAVAEAAPAASGGHGGLRVRRVPRVCLGGCWGPGGLSVAVARGEPCGTP